MNSVFSEQILEDKLSKLNNTQQCIETLSHWCIFHRQKAEQVVQTWAKQFHSLDKERKIPFLYLANDILQNSKRKGNEFVEEFWKVLPSALKDVSENGDDRGKKAVSRLVNIWEERKVFGSRAHGLNELMLGNEPLPTLEFNKKRSRSVRILKRDSRSIKAKLPIGGTAEKIVSAFHSMLSEHPNEDAVLKTCKDAVHRVEKMEKSVAGACSQAGDPQDPRRVSLIDKLEEEETLLKQSIEDIRSIESTRETVVSQLQEALRQQESELENIRTQLQVLQAQIEEAANMKRRLKNEPTIPSSITAKEQSKKTPAAIAAEVADRLTASTHSQQIMTSVLSSFAAEAKNAVTPSRAPNSNPENTAEKRLKLEKPMHAPTTTFVASQPIAIAATQQYQPMLVQQPPMQSQGAAQPQYNLFQAPGQPYFQPTGGGAMMIGVPYTYSSLPPPPPHQMVNMARPMQLPPPQQQPMAIVQQPNHPTSMTHQQPSPLNQQPLPPSFRPLQPPGMAFYHQYQAQ